MSHHKPDSKGLLLSHEQLSGLLQLLEKADVASFSYEDADVKLEIIRRMPGETPRIVSGDKPGTSDRRG